MGEAAVYEVADGVAWLVMNRPESANALNAELRQALKQGFERFAAEEAASVLVLTGTGDKAFCAGADLREMADTGLKVPPPDFVPQPGRTIDIAKPIIAAVNGAAYGGGFLLAQSCDLCVAADNARFAISEAKWGRGSPWAAPLPSLVPPRVAMELLVTGQPISAERAYQVGLVNRVVPNDQLRQAAIELARVIADNAPLSVRAGKQLVYSVVGMDRTRAWQLAENLYRPVYLSDDAMEGPRAFTERRPPRWAGR